MVVDPPRGTLVESTGSTANTRLFAGEEVDPDLGLINLRSRQYKPGTGRFLTLDQLPGVGMGNRYLYAKSDPVDPLDPSGQVSAVEFAAVVAIAQATVFLIKPPPPDVKVCLTVGTVGGAASFLLGTFPGYGPIVALGYEGLCLAVAEVVYLEQH